MNYSPVWGQMEEFAQEPRSCLASPASASNITVVWALAKKPFISPWLYCIN